MSDLKYKKSAVIAQDIQTLQDIVLNFMDEPHSKGNVRQFTARKAVAA